MTDNWYIILELEFDPSPVHDEAVIAKRIDEKHKIWAKNFNDFQHGTEYHKYHQMIPQIKRNMIGERNIRTQLIKEACSITFAPIDKFLKMMGRRGEISHDEVQRLAAFRKVSIETVERRATACGVIIGADKAADFQSTYYKYYKNKPTQATAFDSMKPLLQVFGANNLYEFLGVDKTLPCHDLLAEAAKKKKTFVKVDATSSNGSKLCGQCKLAFKDDASKSTYDTYLEWVQIKSILNEAKEFYEIRKSLSKDNTNEFIRRLTTILMDMSVAQDLFVAFCEVEGIAYSFPTETSNAKSASSHGTDNINMCATKSYAIKEVSDGVVKYRNIIIKNEKIIGSSIKRSYLSHSLEDSKRAIEFEIYENDFMEEYFDVDEGLLLSTIMIELPINLSGWTPPVELELELDVSGILNVQARDTMSGNVVQALLKTAGSSLLSQHEKDKADELRFICGTDIVNKEDPVALNNSCVCEKSSFGSGDKIFKVTAEEAFAQIEKMEQQLSSVISEARSVMTLLYDMKRTFFCKTPKPIKVDGTVFGIDFGATNSRIAYINEEGTAVTIKNREGYPETPSVVEFESPTQVVVGKVAKENAFLSPQNVAMFVRPLMGRSDYVGRYHGEDKCLEEVSAFVLRKIVNDAAEILNTEVKDVVITYPGYFGINEKMALKTACEIAGINVLEAINESLAAAIYYGYTCRYEKKTVLIYDLGGSSLNVVVMDTDKDKMKVVCYEGNHELGGKDWDEAVMRYLYDEFVSQTSFDGDFDESDKQTLRLKAESAKQHLTSRNETRVGIDASGLRASIVLSRETFDELTSFILDETFNTTDAAIAVAKEMGYKIDEILLVGGSTKMKQVSKALVKKYGIVPIAIDPDEAVVKGAAIHANNILAGRVSNDR